MGAESAPQILTIYSATAIILGKRVIHHHAMFIASFSIVKLPCQPH